MSLFFLSLSAFLLAHIVPSVPNVRARLVALLGRRTYLALYSAISLILLWWLIAAAQTSADIVLWNPAPWQWWLPFAVMPAAIFLLVAGLIEANPLSISLRSGDSLPAIASVTRHPIPLGFLLWALAHMPANGRVVPLVLFGAMALLAGAGFPLLDRKARRRLGRERWLETASARPAPGAARRLWAAVAVSLSFYLWFVLAGHAWLIGRDPMAGLRAFL